MDISKHTAIVLSIITGILLLAGLVLLLNSAPGIARAASVDFFVTPGGSGDCAQSTPCDLPTALGTANDGDTLYLAGGIYTGSGKSVISPTQSITLCGGWDGAPDAPAVRDSALYPTTLDGEGQRRVVYVNAGITLTLDGLIITGGNATGLGGGPFAGSEAGGGIYSRDAFPIIQNNVITDNVASTLPGVRALGGGIYINGAATAAVVRHNVIVSNTAGIAIQQGDGGGFFVDGPADVSNNTFRENVACVNCSSAYGGGAYIGWTNSNIVIAHNLFEGNQAKQGGGIELVWSAAQVNDNTFTGNTATQGAGLNSWYDEGSNIEANIIVSNVGSGVRIYITVLGTTHLVNNIIANNQGPGAGVDAYSDWHISAIEMAHNTLVGNGTGVRTGRNMTATLTNNIVATHTVGLEVTDPDGNIFADHTLFWANTDDGIRGTAPVDGDPAFVAPAANDVHITPASAAMNAGADAGVTTDFDGDPRPSRGGYDIGADEIAYRVCLPLVVRANLP